MNDNKLNLNFTGALQAKTIVFLDVRLTGDNNVVVSNLYRKPSAGNTLLRADSSQSGHTINSILVGQFLRLRRLCSKESDFDLEAVQMSTRFKERGYSRSVINRGLTILYITWCDSLSQRGNLPVFYLNVN